MQVNRIILALVCAGLAAPALAEKCSVCDFSDEPIVVKPKQAAGTAPSVNEIVVTKLTDSASEPLLSQRDRPQLRGTVPNGGEVARWNFQNAWPSKGGTERPLASPQATPPAQGPGPYSKTLTFTLSTTNPLEPAARLATPTADASKPKEIVVVGSKIAPQGSLPATPMNGRAILQQVLPGTAARR
jgi:hypothetical protein